MMLNPDIQQMIARDIQREHLERAERLRLVRGVRAAQRRSPIWSTRTQRVGSWSGRLEPC